MLSGPALDYDGSPTYGLVPDAMCLVQPTVV